VVLLHTTYNKFLFLPRLARLAGLAVLYATAARLEACCLVSIMTRPNRHHLCSSSALGSSSRSNPKGYSFRPEILGLPGSNALRALSLAFLASYPS
jgi:hypothetical protein